MQTTNALFPRPPPSRNRASSRFSRRPARVYTTSVPKPPKTENWRRWRRRRNICFSRSTGSLKRLNTVKTIDWTNIIIRNKKNNKKNRITSEIILRSCTYACACVSQIIRCTRYWLHVPREFVWNRVWNIKNRHRIDPLLQFDAVYLSLFGESRTV